MFIWVVRQPKGNLGYLCREVFNLYAVKLVDVDLDELEDVEVSLAAFTGSAENFELKLAQLPIGDDQEVSAAAGAGSKNFNTPYLLMQLKAACSCFPSRH
ncbi:MAG: hypothetical protein MZV70_58920 [Desulfobacterales bacterium]|nr:hypothetical protein [Desulfobacterales bacterium]